jgi:hypothetical protein
LINIIQTSNENAAEMIGQSDEEEGSEEEIEYGSEVSDDSDDL